jgi:hypothetical protein
MDHVGQASRLNNHVDPAWLPVDASSGHAGVVAPLGGNRRRVSNAGVAPSPGDERGWHVL